jgi:methyl-accepting chemotaxis protein
MAADNQAQALAVTEITSAVASMDQSTQQNAAMVEHTASAARNLNGNVNVLVEKAEIFKFERRTRSVGVDVDRRADLPSLGSRDARGTLPMPAAPRRRGANDPYSGQAIAAE